MAGVNKVILVGNLGADPESRSFSNGGEVVNLRIATSETWKDRDGNRQERVERQERTAARGNVEIRHVTQTRPRLGVTVTIGPCIPRIVCPPMKLARWAPRRDELLGQLPKELRSRPDTRFEIGARTIAGAPAIYTYQLGYAAGTDDKDQPSIDYSDAYILYYNDGVNQMRVMAHYLDDAVGGLDQLLALAPPEDLEKLATAFASFYVHAWN